MHYDASIAMDVIKNQQLFKKAIRGYCKFKWPYENKNRKDVGIACLASWQCQ